MKTIIIILSVLLILILSGVLYGRNKQPDWVETMTAEEVYTHQFQDSMPEVILDPMAGFPLY
jgi:hypothetical protein